MKKYKSLLINPELHKEIKIASAVTGKGIGEIIEAAFRDWQNKAKLSPKDNGSKPEPKTGEN